MATPRPQLAFGSVHDPQSSTFQILKPICVRISQLTLQHRVQAQSGSELFELLRQLSVILTNSKALISKLTDYVFFPLSCIFRQSATLPPIVVAAAVRCLDLTIEKGWSDREMELDLIEQLLIFLGSHLERGAQDSNSQDVQESGYACLNTLLKLQPSASSRLLMEKGESKPMLGQLVHTALASASNNSMAAIQSRALTSVNVLIQLMAKSDLSRKFFPGIVSQLTSILQPSTQNRRNYRVIVLGLAALQNMFNNVLCEPSVQLKGANVPVEDKNSGHAWIRSVSSQILLASSKVMKLKSHARIEVRDSLLDFCCLILRKRTIGLEQLFTLVLKTSVSLCSMPRENTREAVSRFEDLVLRKGNVQSIVGESCHEWLTNLPNLTHLSNEDALEQEIRRITYACQLLYRSDYDIHALGETWSRSLEESVNNYFKSYEKHIHPSGLAVSSSQAANHPSHTVSIRSGLRSMPDLNQVMSTSSLALFREMFVSMKPLMSVPHINSLVVDKSLSLDPVSGATALWILSQALSVDNHEAHIPNSSVNSWEAPTNQFLWAEIALERALAVLEESEVPSTDWKIQALAIEIITKVAKLQGAAFRLTFFDTLYPLVQMLGADEPTLREYAILSLNYVSSVCHYESAGEMIEGNIDYLVNAIALKLNTFEIDPRATKILVMMLELSGPTLIPYLEDISDSIFAILASYHGYAQLVDALFSVLYAIVQQASSSNGVHRTRLEHHQMEKDRISFTDAMDRVKDLKVTWNNDDLKQNSDKQQKQTGASDDSGADLLEEALMWDEKPMKPSRTYSTVQSIIRLCQFYLSQEQVALRQRLLNLITSGCSIMSTIEDEFLPLVNDIWPMIIQRLYDSESSVIIAATETLSKLCEEAGNFLASRIESDWQPIKKLFGQLVERGSTPNVAKADIGSLLLPKAVLSSMIGLLVSIVFYVRLTPEMEDDVFSMLTPFIETHPHAKEALQGLNEDFLWLETSLPRLTYSLPNFNQAAFISLSDR